ncbi:hypothetical protein PFFCH_04843 [Plasmodium falciparum FCH/4]|uniref:Uncharacterized protein n=1 Tax=Plasmodium falciparum FCH/4 TaxID=1036724 RepID=A0A024VHF2_PLAFA|nr:hypothetical protein PFFCH_04843 [Plasmodium falciparum FCH/4]
MNHINKPDNININNITTNNNQRKYFSSFFKSFKSLYTKKRNNIYISFNKDKNRLIPSINIIEAEKNDIIKNDNINNVNNIQETFLINNNIKKNKEMMNKTNISKQTNISNNNHKKYDTFNNNIPIHNTSRISRFYTNTSAAFFDYIKKIKKQQQKYKKNIKRNKKDKDNEKIETKKKKRKFIFYENILLSMYEKRNEQKIKDNEKNNLPNKRNMDKYKLNLVLYFMDKQNFNGVYRRLLQNELKYCDIIYLNYIIKKKCLNKYGNDKSNEYIYNKNTHGSNTHSNNTHGNNTHKRCTYINNLWRTYKMCISCKNNLKSCICCEKKIMNNNNISSLTSCCGSSRGKLCEECRSIPLICCNKNVVNIIGDILCFLDLYLHINISQEFITFQNIYTFNKIQYNEKNHIYTFQLNHMKYNKIETSTYITLNHREKNNMKGGKKKMGNMKYNINNKRKKKRTNFYLLHKNDESQIKDNVTISPKMKMKMKMKIKIKNVKKNTHGSNTHSNNTHGNNTHSNNTYSNNTHSNNTYSNNTHGNNTHSNNTHGSNIYNNYNTYDDNICEKTVSSCGCVTVSGKKLFKLHEQNKRIHNYKYKNINLKYLNISNENIKLIDNVSLTSVIPKISFYFYLAHELMHAYIWLTKMEKSHNYKHIYMIVEKLYNNNYFEVQNEMHYNDYHNNSSFYISRELEEALCIYVSIKFLKYIQTDPYYNIQKSFYEKQLIQYYIKKYEQSTSSMYGSNYRFLKKILKNYQIIHILHIINDIYFSKFYPIVTLNLLQAVISFIDFKI